MIHVTFEPDKLTGAQRLEWDAWQLKAEEATQKIIDAWEEWRQKGSPGEFDYKLDQKVWAQLKEWLLDNVFFDKCAYCETRVLRSSYHAEHFRPKGRVTVKVKNQFTAVKTQDEEGKEIEHPGYFWLAYNWANLVPSCNDCNTARGKRDQFPVKKAFIAVKRFTDVEAANLKRNLIESPLRKGVYFLQPEDLNILEEPLLLHPYVDDPTEHLVFGDFGMVTAREDETGNPSEKGEQSIKAYDLKAEKLRIARQIAQETVLREYSVEFTRGHAILRADRVKAAKASIDGYRQGKEPYSAAVLAHLREEYPTHKI